jgi:hypothetical protein
VSSTLSSLLRAGAKGVVKEVNFGKRKNKNGIKALVGHSLAIKRRA